MFKKILIILIIIIGAFAIAASMQPDEFRVERSTTINAPARKIFPEVNTAKSWETWSPWAKVDPNAKFTYEGPESGVGAISKWEGNMQVGVGQSTITESRTNEFIKFQLDFAKPLKSTSTAEFTFKPEGKTTVVTWTMYGKNNFIGKAMSLIFNCQKMIGSKFEEGLANLKSISEAK